MGRRAVVAAILFLNLTGIRDTVIRVNFDNVKYYYEFPQGDYFQSRVEFIDKTFLDIKESVEEIDIALQDEVSKKK